MNWKVQVLEWYQRALEAGMPDPDKQLKDTSNELSQVYKNYLKQMKSQLEVWVKNYENLSFANKLEVERLLNIANVVNSYLEEPSINIASTIKNHALTSGENAYNSVWYELEQAHNITLDFALIDPKYIETLIDKPVAGKKLSKRLGDNINQLAKATTDSLALGMLQGKGYKEIARDISNITQASYNRSVRIARTEGGRIQSLTTLKAYDEAKSKGVELEKMWLATLDGRTRHNHGQLDGKIIKADEDFKLGGLSAQAPRLFGRASLDINCRCTTRPIVDGIAPTVRRDNETGEVELWQSYDGWKKKKNLQQDKLAKDGTVKKSLGNFIKLNFIQAKGIKEAEKFARKTLGFKNVSYQGVDLKVANEWNKGLADNLSRFPELKKQMNFTGESHQRLKMLKSELVEDYYKEIRVYPENKGFSDEALRNFAVKKINEKFRRNKIAVSRQSYASSWSPTGKIYEDYSGVSINNNYGRSYSQMLKLIERDVSNGFHPVGTGTIRSILDHELGHQLDELLGIRKNKRVQEIFDSMTNEEITKNVSRYSWDNKNTDRYSEFIAECWSEFTNNPNVRAVAKEVGEIIENEYNKKYKEK